MTKIEMTKNVHFKELHIHAKTIPCAHSCKYCLMGKKRLARITPLRFLSFVERFMEWSRRKSSAPAVGYILNYTANYDRDTLVRLRELKNRFDVDYAPLRSVTLGGLPWRDDEGIRAWLTERQEFGLTNVHASLAGTGSVHDYWNGQKGNFDLLMRTLKLGRALGMSIATRIFVTKSTVPLIEELCEMLDRFPPHSNDRRYALPFFYAGWGAKLESERIDETIRDSLPNWFGPLIERSSSEGCWRSEREWIADIESRTTSDIETKLIINLTDANIERLEAMSCDAIFAEYEQRTLAAYAAVPNLRQLCDRYGNRNGRDIYVLERCIETKWLDQHLASHPVRFERQLTHLQMGN
jgi:hypothetical protein